MHVVRQDHRGHDVKGMMLAFLAEGRAEQVNGMGGTIGLDGGSS